MLHVCQTKKVYKRHLLTRRCLICSVCLNEGRFLLIIKNILHISQIVKIEKSAEATLSLWFLKWLLYLSNSSLDLAID